MQSTLDNYHEYLEAKRANARLNAAIQMAHETIDQIHAQRGKRRLKSWKPDIAWKWWKWTIGFWRDVDNNTVFGIDIFPLEIVWRYEGYRP